MYKVGIIGCGNMGRAILRGIIARRYIARGSIIVSDKDAPRARKMRRIFKVGLADSNSELIKKCKVVILAVKPQDLGQLFREPGCSWRGKLLISICAGVSTRALERRLGKVALVRVMPNMPAQINQGISALSLGRFAKARDKKIALSLFSCIGEVVEVKEKFLDVVTVISGSGPAYFFYLAECLIKRARCLGISASLAQRLVKRTALGSTLLMDSSKTTPQDLRKLITSKGGITEAAFKVFKKKGLENILGLGLDAALKRSNQLRLKE
jgi:pyrroline-5-carboxylate reductase